MGRSPCCEKAGLKKGPWTPDEDHKLLAYIDAHGHGSWRALPSKAGLQRCGKSCRLRWTNYLRPDIKRGKFNLQEEQTIIQLHALLGNRWSAIATHLPKRTDNEIKNYWNTHIKKRLTKMGIDPITHKRRAMGLGSGQAKNVANYLSHMAQWENARLEAEARLVREAKRVATPNQLLQHPQTGGSTQLVCRPSALMRPRPHCLDVLKAWQGIMWDKLATHGTTLESPTSTLNFPETPRTTAGFVPNNGMQIANYGNDFASCDQGMIMKQNVDQNELKTLEQIELQEMAYPNDVYPINSIMEGLSDLVDSAGHNLASAGDFEENWNNILNNLANSSPLDF